ncbi:MAG: tRNA dihydrouridine synthase DusB [Candidatus Eisenbacteria bacterium]|nr:tRNA dihydrouridine synthase DusB [Candidatus Eisenbacteria bacterium]
MPIPGLERRRPLLLAPMEEITDQTFRRLARRFGADLVFTEFVSSEGVVHDAPKSLAKFALAPDEHPVGIQIFGARIAAVVASARRAAEAGADLIDLNAGCPVRKVAGKGGGAGLLRTPQLLEEMAQALVDAVALPVTVKIRLGWDERSINVVEIATRLERAGAAAVTVHARTRSQRFRPPADWSWIGRVKQAVSIPVIGNGDVWEPADAARLFDETACDAVMIGRAAMGNPWIFSRTRHYLDTGTLPPPPSTAERFGVLLEHLREAVAEKGERRGVIEMRKLYRGYLRGLPGAARLRAALMEPLTLTGVQRCLADYGRAQEIDLHGSASGPPARAGGSEGTGRTMEEPATDPRFEAHLAAARAAARRAWAPPRERCGAVAISRAGERFCGATMQLAAPSGLSVCAEQVALCAARAAGAGEIACVCLWIGPAAGDHPCGTCRQIWLELAPRARWLLQRGDQPPQWLSLDRLLPDPFRDFSPER